MFVETWLEAQGYTNVRSQEIPPWRRAHMSNLVNAFDFDHPDYSIPTVASAPAPLTTPAPEPSDGPIGALSGNYVGAAKCAADYPTAHPPVPYNEANANQNMTLATEEGFKPVRGALTEGRYLTFEFSGFALSNSHGRIGFSRASSTHNDIHQRWVLHQVGDADSHVFTISSALDGTYITNRLSLSSSKSNAQQFTMTYLGNGNGYTASFGGQTLTMGAGQSLAASTRTPSQGFDIYSVTYHS